MPIDTRPPVIAVMGPTASGKTAFALECARALGGEIVSVDSALVYRGLDVGATVRLVVAGKAFGIVSDRGAGLLSHRTRKGGDR